MRRRKSYDILLGYRLNNGAGVYVRSSVQGFETLLFFSLFFIWIEYEGQVKKIVISGLDQGIR